MHKALEKGDPRHEYIVGCKSCRCARFFSYRSLPCRTLACESTSVSGRLDFCVEEKQKHAQKRHFCKRPASVHCLDEDMKIPWKEANEGSPVSEEQYQERFFGLWSVRVHEHVTTRKTQRRIHAGDRRSGRRSSYGLYPALAAKTVPGRASGARTTHAPTNNSLSLFWTRFCFSGHQFP